MNNKELIQSLKQLKNQESAGKPSADFVAKNREILLMQIKNSTAPAEKPFSAVYFWRLTESLMPENIFRFVVRPVALSLLVFGVAFGSWAATVSASYDSLPGDTLYSLKMVAEKAQLSFTSGDNKVSLQAEFAGRRLEEIAKIAERPEMENKDERTIQAVANFSQHIKAVKSTLENINEQSGTAATVAQMVDRKTAEFADALDKAKTDATEGVKNEMDKASNLVTDTGIKAIEVMIKQSEQGGVQINQEEVANKIEEKIKTAEQSVVGASAGVDAKKEATDALNGVRGALAGEQLGTVVDKLVEAKNLVNTVLGDGTASSTADGSASSTNK